MSRKAKEFKIPKPPRVANAYATYSKEQVLTGVSGAASHPCCPPTRPAHPPTHPPTPVNRQFSVLTEGSGPEKWKQISIQWKELDADQQAKYARDGEIDHERKMNLWHEQAGEREVQRIEHCAKLGVAKDTTWEQLKKIHDGK